MFDIFYILLGTKIVSFLQVLAFHIVSLQSAHLTFYTYLCFASSYTFFGYQFSYTHTMVLKILSLAKQHQHPMEIC